MKKADENWQFPRTRLQWLWDNMEGYRAIYVLSVAGTFVYNMMQLTVPFFSSQIVDRFLSGPEARANFKSQPDEFYKLIFMMIGFTILRCIIVYVDCVGYEKVSQGVLFRIRNFIYDKIQRRT